MKQKKYLTTIKRGDVIKIWRKSWGGTGRDYVVIGKWNASDDNRPLLVIIRKSHINANGTLHKMAKFYLCPAEKTKAIVGHIAVEPLINHWEKGELILSQTSKTTKAYIY